MRHPHEDLLNHPLISERYFFPRRVGLKEAVFVDCKDARLACYHLTSPLRAKTLVHFHGNGEIVADYVPDYVQSLTALGVNVFLVEYRGYGASSGKPALGQMLDDVEPILNALGCAQEQILVYGRSVGSIYAIEMAARYPKISGLVLESGIFDVLERLLLRVDPAELGVDFTTLNSVVSARLDHTTKLGSYRGPLLVMHAADDELVDPSHARQNWAAAGCDANQKTLHLFQHGGHNGLMSENWPEYLGILGQFFAKCGT